MRKNSVLVFLVLLIGISGCAKSHFGVADKAVLLPPDVSQTEEAIASAKQSDGATYCPEKISQAEAMATEAMNVYWGCQTDKALGMLSDARNLANEAKACQPPPAPAPAPMAPPPPPARQPISFHSVYFNFDSADLTASARAELDKAAKIMVDNPDVVLELQGHTCDLGAKAYNRKLGERRAESVFGYLTSEGISADRLKTVSFGVENPVSPNTTKEGRAKNRRVDMVILK